jgi:hypothetical protein
VVGWAVWRKRRAGMTPFFNVVVRVGEGPRGLVCMWLVRERVNVQRFGFGDSISPELFIQSSVFLCIVA